MRSYERGHLVVSRDGKVWRYADTGEVADDKRSCKRCGQPPTPEGHDACLGHIEGAISMCCGHGIATNIIIIADKEG